MKRVNISKYYMRAKRAIRAVEATAAVNVSTSQDLQLPVVDNDNGHGSEDDWSPQESENDDSVSFQDQSLPLTYEFEQDNNAVEKHFKIILAEWALKHNICHSAINDLLKILQPVTQLSLPLDARTLLQTTRTVEIKDVHPGQYFHFGIQNCIHRIFVVLGMEIINQLSNRILLNINIDGLPLAKSSSSQVYPILANISGFSNVVEMIGIYHGLEKPNDANEFLFEFVQDAKEIIMRGFVYNKQHYSVQIKAIICDAPAKSFVKCVKGHSGYSSCTKCIVYGEYKDRIFFPDVDNFDLRTDLGFRNQVDPEHHTGKVMEEERLITWTVIQFIDDDGTVEAVPSCWIRGEFCYWPTYSKEKVLAAIKNCEPLNTSWPCHRVKSFRNATYDDYLKARSKAKLAEETSDLNTADDENTVSHYKRKRVPKVLSSSEESDEEEIETILPPTPKLKKSFNVSTSVKTRVPSPVTNDKTLLTKETSKLCDGCSGNDKNFKTIFQQNHVLRSLLTDTLTEVRLLRQELKQHPRTPATQQELLSGGGTEFAFPITNDEDFQNLESYLEDAEKFSNMVSELSGLGGSSTYDAVKRAMSILLSNEQAVKFSWYGRKGKRPFLNLNLAKVLIRSIEKMGISPSQKASEIAIQTWLRRATDRVKAAMLKKI